MATSKNAHAPFPDVTGLRTSGPDFSRVGHHCKLLRVQETIQLDSNSASSFANGDLSLALLSAWSVILFHYGSHEATNVEVLHTSPNGDETVVELEFAEQRELNHLPPTQLANFIQTARQQHIKADSLDHGYAAFYQPVDAHASSTHFDNLQLDARPEVSLALSYHVAKSTHLVLEMKAAPSVHSEQSAQLQLRQVAALLTSYHNDSQQHALSVERFDWKLRASDNPNYVHLPDPDHLEGRDADRSTKWTYAEMNQRAEKVKQLLWSHGIGSASSDSQADHIVALYLEKSPETYLSFIGVLKAGAAWCPIDTDWPASRRQALLAKSNAKIVLTHDDKISAQLQEDLQSEDVRSKGGMKAIRLDQLDEELQHLKSVPSAQGTRSIQQLAYMIWTSGTTGLPKGVGIQHLAIIQAMRALPIYIPYGKDKIGTDQIRYLQYSAYNLICRSWTASTRGALVHPAYPYLLTPAVMAMTERHRCPSLKVVISGGEKLSQVVADEWSKDCCLLNLYGPAEATLIAMNRRVPFGDRVKAPNIGVALPTVSCHALDKYDRVVIKGAVGELVLGGPQLARGYVGDPVKTADKFFPHPQLGRVYRTGDLVRQLDNQEFEYLGRIDDQVKINGIRIELLEINAAIKNSHDKIKDSETMAFPKKDNESEQQIINFSALPGGQPGELLRTDNEAIAVARELQSNAKDNLPSYMVPNLFVILSHFPRTSSAKIDRVALKNVLATFDQLDWETSSPTRAMMMMWTQPLPRPKPRLAGGYPVSVLDVARFPSLKALSEHLQSSQSSTQERAQQATDFLAKWDAAYRPAVSSWLRQREPSVQVADIQSVLPCTPLQEGMLAESQRDTSSYRIQRQYRLPSDCDEQRLRQVLIKTVERFDSLRTSFADVGSLDADGEAHKWPFQPHFLQIVWKSFHPQIRTLQIQDGADVEQTILSTARSELCLEPFGSSLPSLSSSLSKLTTAPTMLDRSVSLKTMSRPSTRAPSHLLRSSSRPHLLKSCQLTMKRLSDTPMSGTRPSRPIQRRSCSFPYLVLDKAIGSRCSGGQLASSEDDAASQSFRLEKLADLGVATEHVLGVEVLPAADGSVKLGLSWQKSVISEAFGNLMLEQFNRSLAALCSSSEVNVESFLRDNSSSDEASSSLYSVTRLLARRRPNELLSKCSRLAQSRSCFEQQMRNRDLPRSTGLAFDAQPAATMTYEELERASDGVAGLLRHLPRNSPGSYIAPLAILKAGHAYLPLDATLPLDRKKELLNDSGAALLITSAEDSETKSLIKTEKLDVSSASFQVAVKGGNTADAVEIRPEDVAFIIYTSGSTGKPKGCLLTQANLAAAIEGFHTRYEEEAPGSFQSPARFLARSAEAFDVHCSRSSFRSASVPLSSQDRQGERIKPGTVPSLRALIIGGEALTLDLCQLWGSEESNGSLVPTLRGEPGELCIGGEQVAKGYLKRPDSSSFVEYNGQWIYRTGDMVRLHPSDEAEYLGRMDGSQSKSVVPVLSSAKWMQPYQRRSRKTCERSAPLSRSMQTIRRSRVLHPLFCFVSGDAQQRDLTSSEQEVADILRSSVRLASDVKLTHNLDLIMAGLDSLTVVTLASKLRKHGYEASVSSIMNDPPSRLLRVKTPARTRPRGQSDADWDNKVSELTAKAKALPQFSRSDSQAISEDRGTPRYITTITIHAASKDHTAEQIRDAWMATLSRHSIYRTVFAEIDRTLVQVVLSPESLSSSWSASTESLPAAEGLAEYHARTARDIAANIASVPALRLKLWQSKDAVPSLTLTCSHAIYDGDSIRMLLKEASDRLSGKDRSDDALPFAAATRALLVMQRGEAKKFWTGSLAGFSLTQVPNLTGVRPENNMEKDYPLALEISAAGDAVSVHLAFDTRLIPVEQANLMLSQYDSILAAFIGAESKDEKHLSILNKDCYTIVARFVGHAQKDPDAPAIAFTTSMSEAPKITSYAELDLLSTNIAQHLVGKAGQFVGVHLNKEGPELYATILAIWKAGKAYLPWILLFQLNACRKPKAVQINQRALAGALYSWERMLPFTQQSRFLQLASIGFDVCLIEICMPLSLGFSIGTAPKQELLEDLSHSIKHLGITIADLPAALAGTVHPDDVQLEWLMSGGHRLLINAWGPPRLRSATPWTGQDGSDTKLDRSCLSLVLDVRVEEGSTLILPSGAIGELVVGGPQLADCYYGRDDLTAEKFILLDDGSRVYRTGDLGRFLHDGVSSALVESDPIVKSRQSSQQRRPYVREDDDAVELCNRLEQEAAKRLAAYMVPTHWIVTSRGLPLTHNNKTDHKALALFYERLDASLLRSLGAKREGAMSSKAWTEPEEKLRKLVAEFCNVPVDQIARNTSFHRLGIDSISAIRLVKELRAIGYTFTVADVLSTPNISALAEKQAQPSSSVGSQSQISDAADLKDWCKRTTSIAEKDGWTLSGQDSIVSILPCTPLQSGMIAQSLASAGSLYFHHHAFQLSEVTPEQVSVAWEKLVERLDILRTTFHPVEGAHPWAQAVHSIAAPRVVKHSGRFSGNGVHKVDGQPSFDDEEAFRTSPHVLHVWPERSQDGRFVIMLSIHHALYDGTSLPQLLDDFELLIAGTEQQLPSRLPFYKLVPSILSQDEDVRHWANALHGFRPTLLATGSDKRKGTAVLVEKQLALTSQELESRCRPIGVSLQVLCNLAFGKLLALESDTRDICFGQLFGLLDLLPEADTAVGPAFNTVATRIRFADLGEPVKKVAASLQSANDAGRPHRRAALREVQAKLHRGQLFDALFDYQRAYDESGNGKLLPLDLADSGEEKAQYALNVAFVQGPSKMSIVAKADSSRYDQSALSALVDRLEALLQHLSSSVDDPVSALPEALAAVTFPEHLAEIATTVNGSSSVNVASAASSTPLSEEGRQLASIISKVAGIDESELHGDTRLSLLGLDSISAIRIASQARKAGIKLRMGEIVAGETINGILASRSQTNGVRANGHALRNGHINGDGQTKGTSAVSPELAQQVASQLGIEADRIERVLPILAGISSDKVEDAWNKLRQLQPILRTAFLLSQDGSAVQVVLKAESKPDLSHFVQVQVKETGDAESAAKEVVARRAAEGWPDLAMPPVQLTLVGDILVFSLHHVLYDAFSIEMLVRDFAALYRGEAATSSNEWVAAVEHVVEEQQQIRADAEQYWAQSLSKTAFHAERRAISVSAGVDAKMRKAGVTLASVVLAAWSTLLCERLGDVSASPVFGLYQLGRSSSFDSIEKVQGPLLNMLPMQVKGDSILEKAQAAAKALKSRAKYEQTDLVDAHRWAGWSLDKPSFNTFVNLLIASKHADDSTTEQDDMQPVDLGHPLSYTAKNAAGKTKVETNTSVTAHAAIFQPDVNVDIVLGTDGNGIDIAIKAKTYIIPETQLQPLVRRLAILVNETLTQL
ncbi:related to Ferrichrome siderophore peptide synthetase [Ustilago trichophora]|uniref:Related to Ferrichrome siderophore peptide synthetase n=1 Tax=Ustilago trichophora TaxID=86804 RepID=A0A5C3E6A5_9BASI|nr:related to Ferrichrome siderophore peptide synthetase [Ustilago trichophora]